MNGRLYNELDEEMIVSNITDSKCLKTLSYLSAGMFAIFVGLIFLARFIVY
jgi:hypothetical protein